MAKVKVSEMIGILQAIVNGWSLVDERDEDDFMVFVDESRNIMESFQPKKALIYEMQSLGYLYPIEPLPRIRNTYYIKNSSDENWVEMTGTSPIVYLFTITSKGEELLNSWIEKTV